MSDLENILDKLETHIDSIGEILNVEITDKQRNEIKDVLIDSFNEADEVSALLNSVNEEDEDNFFVEE